MRSLVQLASAACFGLVAAGAAAMSPAEEFEAKTSGTRASGFVLPSTAHSATPLSGPTVRVMDIGRREPVHKGAFTQGDIEQDKLRRERDNEGFRKRTTVEPVNPPQMVCHGPPSNCVMKY